MKVREMSFSSYLKEFLLKAGLWYRFDKIRQSAAVRRWLNSGGKGAAPHSVKMMIIQAYLKEFSLDQFIETGTYLGDTLGYIAQTGVNCTSIELSTELYGAARSRFRSFRNVTLINGDSGSKLPELLHSLDEPALFWLDGHYSAGVTARADADTPISKELDAILRHPIKKHVILVDDVRYFNGMNDYPHLDELLQILRRDGTYDVEVSMDIVRAIPRHASS